MPSEGLFPTWKHTNKAKGERCHHPRPCHPSPHSHTDASGHRASIEHRAPLTRAPGACPCHRQHHHLKGINFPAAVPDTALVGSPAGAGTQRAPLSPEGSSRGPAAKQRWGPPAPVRQGRKGTGDAPAQGGPEGAGRGQSRRPSLSLLPSFPPSLPPPMRGPGGRQERRQPPGADHPPSDPARPPRRAPVPAPRAEPGSDCATAARRDMGRAGQGSGSAPPDL